MNPRFPLRSRPWLQWALLVLIVLPLPPATAGTPWDRFQKKRREIQRKAGHALVDLGRRIEQLAERMEDSREGAATPRRDARKATGSGREVREESEEPLTVVPSKEPASSEPATAPENFQAGTHSSGAVPATSKEAWVDHELEAAVEGADSIRPAAGSEPTARSGGKEGVAKSPVASEGALPYGRPVAGKSGFVYPPDAKEEGRNMIDVRDFKSGQQVRDPRTGRLFRVP